MDRVPSRVGSGRVQLFGSASVTLDSAECYAKCKNTAIVLLLFMVFVLLFVLLFLPH